MLCPTHHEPADRDGKCDECRRREVERIEHERDVRTLWAQR